MKTYRLRQHEYTYRPIYYIEEEDDSIEQGVLSVAIIAILYDGPIAYRMLECLNRESV